MNSKELKLDSQVWCDILFEDKNKNYGAYQLRRESSRRHVWAFLISVAMATAAILLPAAVKKAIIAFAPSNPNEGLRVTVVDLKPDDVLKKVVISKITVPEPPKTIETVKFTPPVMVDRSEITDDNALNMAKITDSKAHISVVDNAGEIGGTIDPAELLGHQVVGGETVDDTPQLMPAHKPEYPGGEKELFAYISANLHYPAIAKDNNIQGTATIKFVVDKNGNVTNVTVYKGFDKNCDNEAARVISSMGKWQPGRDERGNPVNAYFTIPIKFVLENYQ